MTVCVVAISTLQDSPVLVGASDRMVTSGDIEFEQEQRKIHALTTAISIMVAGDLTVQADILYAVIARKNHEAESQPDVWLSVKQVADWFYEALSLLIRAKAANTILLPLGLTLDALISPGVAPQLANDLSKEMLNFQIDPIQAIVFGIDTTGAHIYEVSNTGVSCQDWTGFASIGAGAWHANSQLMFGNHVKSRSMAETMMLVYSSKKRAEVAPGVGEVTDMILIGPELGYQTPVGPHIIGELQKTYEEAQVEAKRIRENGNAKITEYLAEVIREASTIDTSAPAGELQATTNFEAFGNSAQTS